MEGTLARTLQKYYKRAGRRIVFKNGMSLNLLALEMWERLNYAEVDPSVLSRILSGDRLFTFAQLKVFASILECSNWQFDELSEALFDDLKKRYMFSQV